MAGRRALVIGLSDYHHPRQFPFLPNAGEHAKRIARLLKDQYHFTDPTLKIGQCDGLKLKKLYGEFLIDAKDADLTLVYFGGHGVRWESDTLLVPTTGEVEILPDSFLNDCFGCRALISYAIQLVPAAKRIFIFDCCRNAVREQLDARGALAHYQTPKGLISPGPDDIVSFSASLDQEAAETQGFSEELIKELGTHFDEPIARKLRRITERMRAKGEAQVPEPFIGENVEHLSLRQANSAFKSDPAAISPTKFPRTITRLEVATSDHYVAVAFGKAKGDGHLRVFNPRRANQFKSAQVDSKIYSIAFSPDGQRLAFGCKDGSVGVWNHTAEPEPRLFTGAFLGPVNHMEWARSGDRLLGCSHDRTVRAFDPDGCVQFAVGKHESCIWSASFHKGGDYFLTGSRDQTCRLWKATQTQRVNGETQLIPCGSPLTFKAPVRVVRFARNGRRFAVGTQGGQVSIYGFDPSTREITLESKFLHERCAKHVDVSKLAATRNWQETAKRFPAPIAATHGAARRPTKA